MKTKVLFLILLNYINVYAQNNIKPELKPFVNFLKENKLQSAKDYVLRQFDSKDIIIISERDHRDLTQYELILEIISDDSFKGNVYTEVGCSNNYQRINRFLLNPSLTEFEKEEELLSIYRDLDYYVIWENYNYYFLLDSIYNINKKRKEEDKILLFPLDLEFDWESFTCTAQYELFDDYSENEIIDRNVIMGKNFLKFFEFAKRRNPSRPKALVIQNTYHGYIRIPTFLPNPNQPRIYSTGQYIFKSYPDITTNIYLNYYTLNFSSGLTNNGLFDAAFAYTNTDNVGFDLKNTPFGNSPFDLYNFGGTDYAKVNFDYIFDGMVFFKPVSQMKFAQGIPNVYPIEFEKQFFERLALIDGISYEQSVKEYSSFLNDINSLKYDGLADSTKVKIEHMIRFWIK